MEKLNTVLEKHGAEWKIIMFLKANVDNYHEITMAEFIDSYSVRTMLRWRKFGYKSISKLAEVFDKEDFSLHY
ncbi:hypothetical protein [Mucilaginibacter polytrichastri]|uniref:Uncharacterized protein n=1 Tax=Mucilaginibacter polytrichastri TaxID=1302689 RepID=A0A1Q6A6M7_9SPHI|nr:hypothetical protein [Mucilaginibacter polytrichastri]OKS89665.1 hypothetical protein RG47T_5150 [Mucilaginibacter polytrichastri]SFT24873.1 hypothetical protein SAMN04487890_12255 [Mucilaginibacter polytrichastri]